jgi:hypothetical protein
MSKSGGDLSLVWVLVVVAYVVPSVLIIGGNGIILRANRCALSTWLLKLTLLLLPGTAIWASLSFWVSRKLVALIHRQHL